MTMPNFNSHTQIRIHNQCNWDKFFVRLLLISCVVFISACNDDLDELKRQVADIRAKPGAHLPPLPAIQPYEPFKYDAASERSPFGAVAPVTVSKPTATRPESKRTREYLEQFPLDTLQMVGSIELQGKMYGLLKDTNGLVNRVQIGSHLGQSDGKVTKVSSTQIIINEVVADGLGGYTERPATLNLKN